MNQYGDTAVFTGVFQSVSFDGSVATANGVAEKTSVVFLYSDQDVHIKTGPAPTATTSDFLLPASTLLAIRVDPNDKVAGIKNTTGGTLWVSEGRTND
jgi:hypothetical protein